MTSPTHMHVIARSLTSWSRSASFSLYRVALKIATLSSVTWGLEVPAGRITNTNFSLTNRASEITWKFTTDIAVNLEAPDILLFGTKAERETHLVEGILDSAYHTRQCLGEVRLEYIRVVLGEEGAKEDEGADLDVAACSLRAGGV